MTRVISFLLTLVLVAVVNAAQDGSLTDYASHEGGAISGYTFTTKTGERLRVSPSGDHIIRVQAVRADEDFLPDNYYEMVANHEMGGKLTLSETAEEFTLSTSATDGVELIVSKSPMRLTFVQKQGQKTLMTEKEGITWSGTRCDVKLAVSDDHFFGAGHPEYARLNKLDLTGTEVKRNYGHQAPLVVPFFISHKGYGIFLNTNFENRFRFGVENEYTFGFDDKGFGGRMDYYFILGPKVADILERYTQLTGKPRLPQKSIFGLHLSDKGSPNNSDEQWWMNTISTHRAAGYPIDHIVNDNRWRAGTGAWAGSRFEWAKEEGRYPDPARWARWVEQNGLTMTLDLNRNISASCWGWDPSFNIPNAECAKYNQSVPDFSSEKVRNWVWELFWVKSIDPTLKYPGDSFWMDEPDDLQCIPDETITADGKRWAENKNRYFFDIAKAVVKEGWDNENNNEPAGIGPVKRPFVWVRGMSAGGQRYATAWTGDINCDYLSMAQHVRSMQASGLSALPYFNHDAGGFHNPGPDDKLYRQWSMAFGSFSPIWRPHGPGRDRWPLNRPAECQKDAMYYAHLRYEMMPYIYTMAWQAHATGMPMARAMMIDYQDEPQAWSSDLQYMWGESLLIAPNCSENSNQVSVWLPGGNDWYDFHNGTKYTGGQTIEYPAETGVLPIFVKVGAIIAKAPYVTSTFWIPADKRTLDIYAGADGSYDLYDDDGITEYFRTKSEFAITNISYEDKSKTVKIAAAKGQYPDMPKTRQYCINIYNIESSVPMSVNNARLSEYKSEQEALNAGRGFVYFPEEKRLFIVTQPISMKVDTVVSIAD